MIKSRPVSIVAVSLSAIWLLSSQSWAEEPATSSFHDSLASRPTLLEGETKEALRARGINTDLSVTQFYQGLVAGDGDGDESWEYGGKGEAVITLDGAKLGLWQGFFVNFHQKWVWGGDVNSQGDGTVLPVNTAMAFPRLGGI